MGMQFSRATAVILLSYFGGCVFVLWVVGDAFGHDDEAAYINGAFQMTALTAPSPGTVSGTVAVSSTCVAAGQPCAKVCYCVDGVLVSNICPTTGPSYTLSWDSTTVIDGNHSLTAVGYSVSNLITTSAAVAVTTSNSVTAQNYYFDSVGGADSNDCKTTGTACKTLTRFATLALHGGDTVNFLAGDTWTQTNTTFICGPAPGTICRQNFWPSSSTLTLTTYGTAGCNAMTGTSTTPPANCATFQRTGGSGNSAMGLVNAANVTVQNFNLIGTDTTAGNYARGLGFDIVSTTTAQNGLGNSFNVTIQNNYTYKYVGAGVNFATYGGNVTTYGPVVNYQILDNYITAQVNATATKSPTTGIGAGPNSQGLIQGNVVEYMAYAASQGNGIVVQNWPNPRATYTTVQFNVVRYNGGNWNSGPGGPYGLYARESDYTLWQFNEEHHQQCWNDGGFPACNVTSNVDNGGMDFDMGTTNSIAQYNYIHDNPMYNGAALLTIESAGVFNPHWTNNVFRYNIFENNTNNLTLSGSGIGQNNVWVYNNTVSLNYTGQPNASSGDGECWNVLNSTANVFNNNCIFSNPTYRIIASWVTYNNYLTGKRLDYNNYFNTNGLMPRMCYYISGGSPLSGCYDFTNWSGNPLPGQTWQTTVGLDPHSKNINPDIAGTPGTGGTCYTSSTSPPAGPQPCPSVYQLNAGSPLIGAGADMNAVWGVENPTRDYYGKSLPYPGGSGYPIGASAGP